MGTALTKGKIIDCRNGSGGMSTFYVVPLKDATLTIVDNEVTVIVLTSNLFQYDLPKNGSQVTEPLVGSTENGTFFFTPTLTVKLNQLTKEDQKEILGLASQRLLIFAKLKQKITVGGHNTIVCLGAVNGMDLNAGTGDSGLASADSSGYNWTFDGEEDVPFSMVADFTDEPFDNVGFTVQVAQ